MTVGGQSASRLRSPTSRGVAFAQGDTTVIAQLVPDHPNRVHFTVLGPHKTAYVVAAFNGDRLHIEPAINGQQLSLSCLRK